MLVFTQGKCPCCKKFFEVTTPTFTRSIPNTPITFVYALCPSCEIKFLMGRSQTKQRIARKCHLNIVKDDCAKWACTTSLALNYHGNFLKAFKEGLNLPVHLIDAMLQGLVKEVAIIRSLLGDKNVKS